MRFSIRRFPFCVLVLGAFALLPFVADATAAPSDSERLEKLERAVELLQKRNAELEQEVQSLKKQKSPATVSVSAPAPLATEKRSHFVPDPKSDVEKNETTKRKTATSFPDVRIPLTLGDVFRRSTKPATFCVAGRFGSARSRPFVCVATVSMCWSTLPNVDFKLEGDSRKATSPSRSATPPVNACGQLERTLRRPGPGL